MKHIMRQTRDGVVEHIDPSPPNPSDGALSAVIASVSWETALLWYMRTLAWVWVSKGLFNWAIVLGAFPKLGDFTTMALPLQATIVAFACFNLLAAVGLWLAAPWGGAIWLLCAMVEIGLAILESARGVHLLRRRHAQRRPGCRLFLIELASGQSARLRGTGGSGDPALVEETRRRIQTLFTRA